MPEIPFSGDRREMKTQTCLLLALVLAGCNTEIPQRPRQAKVAKSSPTILSPKIDKPVKETKESATSFDPPINFTPPPAGPQFEPDEDLHIRAAEHGIGRLNPETMQTRSVGLLDSVNVLQVVDERTVLAKWRSEVFFVAGLHTSNMVDGRTYDTSDCVFYVEGTKRYTTTLGASKQVLSLRRIDTPASRQLVQEKQDKYAAQIADFRQKEQDEKDRIEREAHALKDAQEKRLREQEIAIQVAQAAADKKAKQRTWTLADGSKVEAEFVSYSAGTLKIRRLDDGTDIHILASSIAPLDMAWIKSRGRK